MLTIDHDLHIHTSLSKCAKNPDATVPNFLAAAEKNNLKIIGIANHCWAAELPGMSSWYRDQDIEHVLSIKNQIPENTNGIKILIGCETEYTGNRIAGLNRELAGFFDFVLLPCNHFHMKGFVVPEDLGSGGPREVAELLYRRFMEVTDLGFGFGIVHPFVPLGFMEHEEDILENISDAMYENCFRAAKSAGLAIEINSYTAKCKTCAADSGFSPLYLRIHSIAGQCGAKFFFGADAHQPDSIGNYDKMAGFAKSCGIVESDIVVPQTA